MVSHMRQSGLNLVRVLRLYLYKPLQFYAAHLTIHTLREKGIDDNNTSFTYQFNVHKISYFIIIATIKIIYSTMYIQSTYKTCIVFTCIWLLLFFSECMTLITSTCAM